MFFIDSHAHLAVKELYCQVNDIILRAKESNIKYIIDVNIELEELENNLIMDQKLSTKEIGVFSSIGIHPNYFDKISSDHIEKIKIIEEKIYSLYKKYKGSIVAIGECGLDYYWPHDKEAQIALFEQQIKIALNLNLPLVIHVRDAWEDLFNILSKYPNLKGVIHCFGSDLETLRKLLKYPNLMISFTGIITFLNVQKNIVPVLMEMPLERIMIETDCPYLAPVPYRGQINEPAYVIEVAKKIAEIKNLPLSDIAEITSGNTIRFFNLPV